MLDANNYMRWLRQAVLAHRGDQGDRNFYTHYRHNIFPQKSLLMCSVT